MKYLQKFEALRISPSPNQTEVTIDSILENIKNFFRIHNLSDIKTDFWVMDFNSKGEDMNIIKISIKNPKPTIYFDFVYDKNLYHSHLILGIYKKIFLSIWNYLESLTPDEIEQFKIEQEAKKFGF